MSAIETARRTRPAERAPCSTPLRSYAGAGSVAAPPTNHTQWTATTLRSYAGAGSVAAAAALSGSIPSSTLRSYAGAGSVAADRAHSVRYARAAPTPPGWCGTPANSNPISTPANVPRMLRSLKSPR